MAQRTCGRILVMIGPISREEFDDRQTNRKIKSLCRLDNNNKVDVQFPHILVRKLHTQACEIVGGTKRKLCKFFTKFQVNTCKTKKDRSAHAQLRQAMIYNAARVWRLSTKLQVHTCKNKKDRSEHAQLRTL